MGDSRGLTLVSAAVASTELLPPRSRSGFIVVNNSISANMYLALSNSASTTSFSVKLTPGSTFISESHDKYKGPVYAYWDSAVGNAIVTEFR